MKRHYARSFGRSRAGLSALSILLIIVILMGLFLGPIQSIYCLLVSGKPVGNYPIKGSKPVTVALSPDMNPIRFSFWFLREKSNMVGQSSTFDGSLTLDREEVWAETFGIHSDPDRDEPVETGIRFSVDDFENQKLPLKPFDIAESGDYQFSASQQRSDLTIKEMSLDVRRNVRPVHMPTAVAGFVMFVLASIVGAVRAVRSSRLSTAQKGLQESLAGHR